MKLGEAMYEASQKEAAEADAKADAAKDATSSTPISRKSRGRREEVGLNRLTAAKAKKPGAKPGFFATLAEKMQAKRRRLWHPSAFAPKSGQRAGKRRSNASKTLSIRTAGKDES